MKTNSSKMSSLLFYCLLFAINVNCDQWDGYHRELDDQLPPISWKDCGISSRKTDPTSNTFVSSRVAFGDFAQNGEFPWFAFIETDGESYSQCGASILNEWWLLTAAHCVDNKGVLKQIRVLIGTADRSPQQMIRGVGRRMYVEYVVLHHIWSKIVNERKMNESTVKRLEEEVIEWEINDKPLNQEWKDKYYSFLKLFYALDKLPGGKPEFYYDIALLKLQQRVVPVFNETHYTVNSICLPKTNIINAKEESVMFIGMGTTSPNPGPKDNRYFLKKGMANMADLNDSRCSNIDLQLPEVCLLHDPNPEILNVSVLYNSSTCLGDSGAPSHQYYHWKAIQIGILSRGSGGRPQEGLCGDQSYETRVSFFMPWIRYHISKTFRDNTLEVFIESKTNHLLIVITFTAAIISLIILLTLLWLVVTILMSRPRNP